MTVKLLSHQLLAVSLVLVALTADAAPPITGEIVRIKRQDDAGEEGGAVIDNIFNIPITALKQTASAVNAFAPGNTETIDSIFKIPVSTLEAVGNLVRNMSPARRRENYEELQKRRAEKRERLNAQKQSLRVQREKIQRDRLEQDQLKRERLEADRLDKERRLQERKDRERKRYEQLAKDKQQADDDAEEERYFGLFHHRDPFGINRLTNYLVGGHTGLHGGHRPHKQHKPHGSPLFGSQGGGLHHQLLSNLANRPILQGIGPINQGLNPAFGPANRPPFKPLQTLGQNLFGSTTSSQSSASSSQSTSTNETEDYDEITDDVIQQQLNNRRKRIRFDELQNKVASNNFYDGRTPYYYQYRRDDPVQHRSFSWGE